jgi:hypothetical protein
MTSDFMTPAGRTRQAEIMPILIERVVAFKDNPAYPLHKERTVRHMLDRWSFPNGFELLDELCGMAGLQDSMFPVIEPVRLYGTEFGNPDILHVDIEWLGTDGVQLVIDYHREAHARMAAEREALIEAERAKRATDYPTLGEVIAAYRKLRRPAWIPVVGEGEGAGKASRYFGRPWLPRGYGWPVNDAGEKLSFVMQINTAELPTAARRATGLPDEGMVSLFYDLSADWEPDYGNSEDSEANATVLLLDAGVDGETVDGPLAGDRGRHIVWWRAVADYPSIGDAVESVLLPVGVQKLLMETGVSMGGTTYRYHGDVTTADDVNTFIRSCEKVWGANACDTETAAEALDLFCGSGNKLGGWPDWDGARRWPTRGGERLAHLLQLDMMSDDWNGFSFWRGDERGRMFIDPRDASGLSLAWDTQVHRMEGNR